MATPLRVVVAGFGPVGARLVEELLPAVSAGLVALTVVGAETAHAYNRVLVAEYAVGRVDRASLDIADPDAARAAGVDIRTGVSVTAVLRSRHLLTLSTGEQLPYDRLVLATGARANIPTLDGVVRVRRDHLVPDAASLDDSVTPLPRGITALRDLADADTVLAAVRAGRRIVVLGAGVLGMEIALAAAVAGAEVCVVYHSALPMARNLDRGAGSVLTGLARRAGVSMVAHSRAESILFRLDDDGVERFDALVCADGKAIGGDLLLLSCGVGARTELAHLAGLAVATGILVDDRLRSWTDPHILAIGDCAQLAARPADGASSAAPSGGPSGLVGPGWRQADWLAADLVAEASGSARPALAEERPALVMLKADGVDVVSAGMIDAEPWDEHPVTDGAHRHVAQWSDPEHGRYVKLVTTGGVLDGFVSVGMPRTAAELTLLFERGSELPADRSLLLRHDGPDYDPAGAGDAFAIDATVCWCNGVTVGAIADAAALGDGTVACVGSATRAGTGCGGCKNRISAVIERFATVG